MRKVKMPVTVCAERWLSSGCLCWGQSAGKSWPCLGGVVGLELWAQAAAGVMKGVHLMEVPEVLEGSLRPPDFQ